jgi:hypothetical protein
MCADWTAGVASVISAVETLPTFMPRFLAFSITDSALRPGTSTLVLGPCEIRSSRVFTPVAHMVPVDAESGS